MVLHPGGLEAGCAVHGDRGSGQFSACSGGVYVSWDRGGVADVVDYASAVSPARFWGPVQRGDRRRTLGEPLPVPRSSLPPEASVSAACAGGARAVTSPRLEAGLRQRRVSRPDDHVSEITERLRVSVSVVDVVQRRPCLGRRYALSGSVRDRMHCVSDAEARGLLKRRRSAAFRQAWEGGLRVMPGGAACAAAAWGERV